MTRREMFATIKAMDNATDAIKAFCDKEIAAIDKKNVKAQERSAKKRAENPIVDKILAVLTADMQTGDEIVAAIGDAEVTKSKVASAMKSLVDSGAAFKGVKKDGKRKLVAYANEAPADDADEDAEA